MHPLMSQPSIANAEAGKLMPAKGKNSADLIASEDLSKFRGEDLYSSDPFSSFQDFFDVAADHQDVARTGDAVQPDLANAPDGSKAAAEIKSVDNDEVSIERVDDPAILQMEHVGQTETGIATTLLPRPSVTENRKAMSNGTLSPDFEWNNQPLTWEPAAKNTSVPLLELPKGLGAAQVAVPSQMFQALNGQDGTKSIPLVQARAQPVLQVQPHAFAPVPNQPGSATNNISKTVREGRREVSEKFDTFSNPNSARSSPIAVKPVPSGMLQPVLSNVAGLRSSPDQKMTLQSLLSEGDILSLLETAHSTSVPNLNDPTRAVLPQHIARQLVEVAQNLPSRPVEITLNPEELGRVRLSVTTSENSLVVNILAERPETLDLMRRHIGQLQQEFKNLGYESIGFSFSQAGSEATDDQNQKSTDHKSQNASSDKDDNLTENTHIHLTTSATAGLDLRL